MLELAWWDLDLRKIVQEGLMIPTQNIKEFIQFIQGIEHKERFKLSSPWLCLLQNPSGTWSIKKVYQQEVIKRIQSLAQKKALKKKHKAIKGNA